MRDAPRFRVVLAPNGSAAVLSDREPGPVPGVGDMHGWTEATDPPLWTDFGDACDIAALWNGKRSTTNMGPREAAEGEWEDPFTEGKRGADIGNLYGDRPESPIDVTLNNVRLIWAWAQDYVGVALAGARAFGAQLKSLSTPPPVTDPEVVVELERRVQAAERLRWFTSDGRPYCPECSSAMLRNTLDPGGFVCNYCGHSLKGGKP